MVFTINKKIKDDSKPKHGDINIVSKFLFWPAICKCDYFTKVAFWGYHKITYQYDDCERWNAIQELLMREAYHQSEWDYEYKEYKSCWRVVDIE